MHLQKAMERQDLSCTSLAHHELESGFVIIIIIIIINAWLCLPRCCKALCVYAMTPLMSSNRSLRLTPYGDNDGVRSAPSTYLELRFVGLTGQKQYK